MKTNVKLNLNIVILCCKFNFWFTLLVCRMKARPKINKVVFCKGFPSITSSPQKKSHQKSKMRHKRSQSWMLPPKKKMSSGTTRFAFKKTTHKCLKEKQREWANCWCLAGSQHHHSDFSQPTQHTYPLKTQPPPNTYIMPTETFCSHPLYWQSHIHGEQQALLIHYRPLLISPPWHQSTNSKF